MLATPPMVTQARRHDVRAAVASVVSPGKQRMYAIAFDMDTEKLKAQHHVSLYENADTDIQHVLESHGFTRRQGSVYLGGSQVNAVSCVMAMIDLARQYSWFATSVRDVRMLRIEEFNDLMPAVQNAGQSDNLFNS